MDNDSPSLQALFVLHAFHGVCIISESQREKRANELAGVCIASGKISSLSLHSLPNKPTLQSFYTTRNTAFEIVGKKPCNLIPKTTPICNHQQIRTWKMSSVPGLL
jgi:hypothetical protein